MLPCADGTKVLYPTFQNFCCGVWSHIRTASWNDCRLVVAIRYDKQIIFIRFVGTHAEYDRIDAARV